MQQHHEQHLLISCVSVVQKFLISTSSNCSMKRRTYFYVVLPQTAQMSFVLAHTVDFVQLVLETCLLRLAHAGHYSLNRQIRS